MLKLYDIWTAYALAVVEAVIGYAELTEDWPVPLSLAVFAAPMVAAKVFLPAWLSMLLFAAVGLPLGWFLVTMILTYYEYHDPRD